MDKNNYVIENHENGYGKCLVLHAPWHDDFADIIRDEKISVLRLSQSVGWTDDNIRFISKINGYGIKGIEIYSWNIKDISPIGEISDIEHIGLQCEFTKAPDFSLFKKLKSAFLLWRPKAKTIFSCSNLEFINIANYPFEDLTPFSSFTKLKKLYLTSRKIISTSSIEFLISLEELDLYGCVKLESLQGLDKCSYLRRLEFENCKKIYDIEKVNVLHNLKKIALIDCGKIATLKALCNIEGIEEVIITGDTDIEDGDISLLLMQPNLLGLRFADRKHYSHSNERALEILNNKS